MPTRPLRLGTRSSPLAMAQAEEARDRLCAAHPGLAVELVPVTASGDRVLDRPLAEIGGKALWTKELDAWLLAGEIDLAVHSAKDVETVRPPAIVMAAVLVREDVRDVLVLRQAGGGPSIGSLADLPQGARIATSAPRRAAQALHLRPDCRVVGIRGNVQTRLARLEDGLADCTLLAQAGLNRLGMAGIGSPLEPETWLPAPGQGAIAIECRRDDAELCGLLAAIDHQPSHQAVMAERALLSALGGTCHSPIAALTRFDRDRLVLRAAIFATDGQERIAGQASFPPGDPTGPANLAAELLRRASPGVRQLFEDT